MNERDARRLERLTTIHTTPGFTDERIHLFLAEGLEPGGVMVVSFAMIRDELGKKGVVLDADLPAELVGRDEILHPVALYRLAVDVQDAVDHLDAIAGMGLLALIYWLGASIYLIDKNVMALSPAAVHPVVPPDRGRGSQ